MDNQESVTFFRSDFIFPRLVFVSTRFLRADLDGRVGFLFLGV